MGTKRNWRKQREDRIRRVNALIQVIATTGRKFFRHGYKASRMETVRQTALTLGIITGLPPKAVKP